MAAAFAGKYSVDPESVRSYLTSLGKVISFFDDVCIRSVPNVAYARIVHEAISQQEQIRSVAPEDLDESVEKFGNMFEIIFDEDKVVLKNGFGARVFPLNTEVTENLPGYLSRQSVATVIDNKIFIRMDTPDGKFIQRMFQLTETGVDIVVVAVLDTLHMHKEIDEVEPEETN